MNIYTTAFKESVLAETVNIKKKLPYKIRRKLNPKTFDGHDFDGCIYGQLNKGLRSFAPGMAPEAYEMRKLVAVHSFDELTDREYNKVFDIKGVYESRMTPLECYAFNESNKVRELFLPFLKGHTKQLPDISQL